ncbi:hypothetical protein [Flavobacterium sp.]|uniref:hypothetical protein n=1 Tax=Flavobacterium sp. TaxID=239 RepID=UPI00286BF2C3|nr:hypothetical protein [Flavobacterium sp.]
MKIKLVQLLMVFFVVYSCKNEDEIRLAENLKDTQKKELIFANINKGWIFNANPINATAQKNTLSWNEWRLFLRELAQKPKKNIGAFQKKATELSIKAMVLNENIPETFNTPQIKARIATLITKVKLLDLFIHLDAIPDQKVILLVTQINEELVSLQMQMDKIVQKSLIPLEEGESDLLKMLDTARAIPNVKPDPNIPRVE